MTTVIDGRGMVAGRGCSMVTGYIGVGLDTMTAFDGRGVNVGRGGLEVTGYVGVSIGVTTAIGGRGVFAGRGGLTVSGYGGGGLDVMAAISGCGVFAGCGGAAVTGYISGGGGGWDSDCDDFFTGVERRVAARCGCTAVDGGTWNDVAGVCAVEYGECAGCAAFSNTCGCTAELSKGDVGGGSLKGLHIDGGGVVMSISGGGGSTRLQQFATGCGCIVV